MHLNITGTAASDQIQNDSTALLILCVLATLSVLPKRLSDTAFEGTELPLHHVDQLIELRDCGLKENMRTRIHGLEPVKGALMRYF